MYGNVAMTRISSRWTEEELAREIDRIGDRIDRTARHDDERSRYAVSYLQQLLRDRRDRLTILRQRRDRSTY